MESEDELEDLDEDYITALLKEEGILKKVLKIWQKRNNLLVLNVTNPFIYLTKIVSSESLHINLLEMPILKDLSFF